MCTGRGEIQEPRRDLSSAHKDLAGSRQQVTEGIAELLDYAKAQSMPLAIEPLHSMFAADRACVNTLDQALDICDTLDAQRTGALGVAIDVYHVWWDPKLQAQIARAGSRIQAFHVCDWLTPTTDLLNDRGMMMGDGVINIPQIRGWVEAQGFQGDSEVEIFSINHWWQKDYGTVLDTCIARHQSAV